MRGVHKGLSMPMIPLWVVVTLEPSSRKNGNTPPGESKNSTRGAELRPPRRPSRRRRAFEFIDLIGRERDFPAGHDWFSFRLKFEKGRLHARPSIYVSGFRGHFSRIFQLFSRPSTTSSNPVLDGGLEPKSLICIYRLFDIDTKVDISACLEDGFGS